MRVVSRINPIYLLIALNIAFFVCRDYIFEQETTMAIAVAVESTLQRLGLFGYLLVLLAWVLCGLFFIPLLIPLNILGGALYGAAAGTALGVAGITLGCIASTVSVRHVFTGMRGVIDNRPGLRRLLERAQNHSNLAIVMMRFTVVVPFQIQNIALAVTGFSATRIALVTAVSAIPGAAIYSLLGAGLVQAEDANQLLLYLAVAVILMLILTLAMAWFRSGYSARTDTDDRPADEPVSE